MARPWVEQIEALLASDRPLSPDQIADLAQRIRADPPARMEDGAELIEAMEALIARSRGQLSDLGTALRRTTKGRRALQGYGSLKATRLSQRTNRVG